MGLTFTAGEADAASSPPPEGPGLFVAFEGGDGAGKTTQIEALTLWMRERGHVPLVTREPGGTTLGLAIRRLLLHGEDVSPRAEALLFAADRAHHVDTVVRPALAAGRVVLTDRYLDSSIAYQGAGRTMAGEEVLALSLWATQGLLPHLTVLLDVPPVVGQARRRDRPDRVEAEPGEFHTRVREHYLRLATAEPHRYLVLDAGLPVGELAAAVAARVEPMLWAAVAR